MDATSVAHPLDNPVWSSMTGFHAELADVVGVDGSGAGRYRRDVCPFGAVADDRDPACWSALDEVLEGHGVALIVEADAVPAGWEITATIPGLQMDGSGLEAAGDPELVELGEDDVADMLALVERTRPGPFLPRTVTMGTYLGLRQGGVLVAMAGERLRPVGWTELSAVCTDEALRGRGLGTRLVRAVGAGVAQRGERPFLHAAVTNETAIRLYLDLGFVVRRTVSFTLLRKAAG
ncbi:MAG TPA: GNAT family N-acetyltransferase [Acidimicrobiales bacterium]|nr:GNAT family N-acetyltransferase [Acidimicrobiales bacterium]